MDKPSNSALSQQFWDRVTKTETGCWLWTGNTTGGYGGFRIDHTQYRAHRLSLANGTNFPEGMHALHTCDTPLCVNDKHLYWGTHADNMKDMLERGNSQKGEGNPNSKLTNADVENIRSLYSTGNHTHRALASRFMVTHGNIGSIVRLSTWKHV